MRVVNARPWPKVQWTKAGAELLAKFAVETDGLQIEGFVLKRRDGDLWITKPESVELAFLNKAIPGVLLRQVLSALQEQGARL